jgi:hypothetical protein
MPGGDALVIQRIADDRLQQMDEKTKAFWLYSSIYDSQLVYGKHPQQFLPDPPPNSPELICLLPKLQLHNRGYPLLLRSECKYFQVGWSCIN